MKPLVRYIIYGQVCFLLGLLLCVIIRPEGLGLDRGISYYGTFRNTILPYGLALLAPVYFSVKAALCLNEDELMIVRRILLTTAFLTIGIVVVPDTGVILMHVLHQIIGSSLFVTQLFLSLWLVLKQRSHWGAWLLVVVQFCAGLAALIWLEPSHGYLLQSQVIFQLSYAALLIYSFNGELTTHLQ